MKRHTVISFGLVIILIILIRWQGVTLTTPASPKGVIDLEFARTADRWQQLLLFMDRQQIQYHLLLDFFFLAAYGWFFFSACRYIGQKTGWQQWANRFASLGISAALFDAAENFLMLLVLTGRFSLSLLEVIYWCAWIKFALAGAVLGFLLLSWPFSLARRRS